MLLAWNPIQLNYPHKFMPAFSLTFHLVYNNYFSSLQIIIYLRSCTNNVDPLPNVPAKIENKLTRKFLGFFDDIIMTK